VPDRSAGPSALDIYRNVPTSVLSVSANAPAALTTGKER
jgi:hypothetical protein